MDTAVYNDYAIPPYYDSMIAKIIVYDRDRRSAIRKMISALGEVAIEGVKTNVDFLYELLNQPDFQEETLQLISFHSIIRTCKENLVQIYFIVQ